MPIQVYWATPEQTVVCCRFSEIWTLEDIHNMIDDMHNLISSVSHTVHSVMDFTDSRVSAARLLTSGNHIQKRSVPNSGISVLVNASGFIKAISQLITKMFMKDTNIYFANNLDEAFQIIAEHEQVQVKS